MRVDIPPNSKKISTRYLGIWDNRLNLGKCFANLGGTIYHNAAKTGKILEEHVRMIHERYLLKVIMVQTFNTWRMVEDRAADSPYLFSQQP